ncbi:MAG: riboflavin biosynthesis protein RibF [Chloroflexi bacterium 54-19]|nr:MAG: riboflavin biosynthesis protein RibF [Chloroflexi bacterium 54-19]
MESLDGRNFPPLVLTIGVFDGVHLGHRALISGAVMAARERGFMAAVMSFDPHPDSVIFPQRPLLYLTDETDKAAYIEEIGADLLIIQPFTLEFSRTSAEDFITRLTQVADIREIHVGEDFAFGHKARGNVRFLREIGPQLGFQVKSLAPLEVDDQVVKSSRIRNLLLAGEVDEAARFLGRTHSLKGEVLHGDKRGRLLGFPTANLAIPDLFAVPGNGVYATMTTFLDEAGKARENPRPSVTNIGTRPTFDNGVRSVETFVLDWSGDLYGQRIRVEFIQRLREERKFAGIEAIRAQLTLDVENGRAALRAAGRS